MEENEKVETGQKVQERRGCDLSQGNEYCLHCLDKGMFVIVDQQVHRIGSIARTAVRIFAIDKGMAQSEAINHLLIMGMVAEYLEQNAMTTCQQNDHLVEQGTEEKVLAPYKNGIVKMAILGELYRIAQSEEGQ